ncbi:hypothetical protein ACFE04_014729 [Oxalis oulophora]
MQIIWDRLYDWKTKMQTHLPDEGSTVVSSILFEPLQVEQDIENVTARCMTWFSAAVSSGVPLVFVNIRNQIWNGHQIYLKLPSTGQGFLYVHSVTERTAADRAGLGHLQTEARAIGHVLVIYRLEVKSMMMPSKVDSGGHIHCPGHNEIKQRVLLQLLRK